VPGVLGGLIGGLFIRINTKLCARRKKSKLKQWPISEVALVCIVTSVIDYPVVYLQGNNLMLLHSVCVSVSLSVSVSVSVCECVCVCVSACVCVDTCIYMYVHICIYM
jgi:chloride channel 3/4/5